MISRITALLLVLLSSSLTASFAGGPETSKTIQNDTLTTSANDLDRGKKTDGTNLKKSGVVTNQADHSVNTANGVFSVEEPEDKDILD